MTLCMHSIAMAIQAWLLIATGPSIRAGSTAGVPPFVTQGPRQILVKVKAPLAKDLESALPDRGREVQFGNLRGVEALRFFANHPVKKLSALHPGLIHLRRKTGWSDAQIAKHLRTAFPGRTGHLSRSHEPPEVSRTYVLDVEESSTESLESIITRFSTDPNVEYAEPNHVVTISSLPNDPFLVSSGTWGQSYRDLWGHYAINAPAAWTASTGGGVIVAVIDTGVDYTHPDIAANMWVNSKEIAGNGIDDDYNGFLDDVRGWDFVGDDYQHPVQSNDPIDHNGHGTHVAGTIAAMGNNNLGIIGVAYNAKIMALRGLDKNGAGSDSTLAPAIIYAAQNGANVINASWGALGTSQTIEEAIQYAYSVGVVFVAAAGNSGVDAWGFFPANSPEAITVAAANPDGSPATSFSNYGTKIDVMAPGVDILSLQASGTTLGQVVVPGYIRLDGTSMAAPHVSGLTALLLSQSPGFPIESLRQTLRASANGGSYGGWYPTQGAGLIDANGALAFTSALQAHFTSPAGQTQVAGPITLAGTAQGGGFDHYVLEYGSGISPTTWHQFYVSTSSSTNSALGVFDPGLLFLPDGAYTLRLTAFDTSGRTFSDCLELEVAFIAITSPPNPTVPVLAQELKPGVQIAISGKVTGPEFQSFKIEWARGLYAISGWSTVGITLAGAGASPVANGTLGTWDTSGIIQADYYTIRVSVDNSGFTSSATTLVYLEPDLLSQNWPQALAQGPAFAGGMVPVADAGGNVLLSLVAPNTLFFPTGQFLKFTPDGLLQRNIGIAAGTYHNPAAGDMSGTGNQDVVFTAEYKDVTIFRGDDSSVAFHPGPANGLLFRMGTIILANLGTNIPLNIVAVGTDGIGTASLFAWTGDGSILFPNLPKSIPDQHMDISVGSYGAPRVLVGDVNGDGFKEFVVLEGLSASTYTLGLYALDGIRIPWAVPVFTGSPTALVLADLDHNGKLETVLIDTGQTVHVFQPDGSERTGWPQALGTDAFAADSIAVGDLTHSGHEQIAVPTNMHLHLFNPDGTAYSNAWPLDLGSGYPNSKVVLADVDGDGIQEIIITHPGVGFSQNPKLTSLSKVSSELKAPTGSVNPQELDPRGNLGRRVSLNIGDLGFNGDFYLSPHVLAFRPDGSVSRSWNLMGSGGNQPYLPVLSVGDFNGDGLTDIAMTYPTIDGGGTGGWLRQGVAMVVSTGMHFNASLNDWPMINRDAQNSSVLTRVQVTPPVPAITGVAPASGTVGDSVTLSGTAMRFSTFVKFDGIPAAFTVTSDNSVIATVPPGATTGTVSITTPGGTASSSTLFALTPSAVAPGITTQPASQTVTAPAPATFNVVATGTGPLTYQWKRNSVDIAGANASTYTTAATTAADSGAQFTVLVSNSAGSVFSNAATLTVNPSQVITVTVSPKGATLPVGGQVILTATVVGTPNTEVGWAIVSGGGVLSNGNAASITYTAPASAGTATISASSQADSSKVDFTAITIKTRDFSGDGITDVLDLATLARAFGSTSSSSNWNPLADLNGDGVVDDLDLALFLAGM